MRWDRVAPLKALRKPKPKRDTAKYSVIEVVREAILSEEQSKPSYRGMTAIVSAVGCMPLLDTAARRNQALCASMYALSKALIFV